jgi:hypothetical protein
MAVEPGRRRVRSAPSKARQEAARELQPASRETGKATTTAVQKVEGVELPAIEKNEILSDRVFAPGEQAAFVRISVGGTYSTQPYESLRLDVSVTLPCRPHEVNATFDIASDLVAERLGEEEILWLGSKR